MDDNEIDQIATRVVQKIMESPLRDVFAAAIAMQLRGLARQYDREMVDLGERLDCGRF